MAIAVKTSAKADIKVFWSCLILLFLLLVNYFVTDSRWAMKWCSHKGSTSGKECEPEIWHNNNHYNNNDDNNDNDNDNILYIYILNESSTL